MQRGNQLFVAGVASRLRYDREPPKCGKGAIYTLTDPEVNVRGTVVDNVIGPFDVDMYCVPTRPIEPFDSRKIIHDTIRRIEETGVSVQMREPGDLGLVQNHRCASPSLRLNGTSYRLPDGFYYVGYDEYGEFLEVRYEEPTQSSILVPAKAFAGRGAPAERQPAK